MDYIAIKDIVRSVSQTHKFEKDYLKAVNTSDVFGGELFDVPYSETTSLKGQFKKTIQYNDILFSEIRPANRRFGRVNIKDTADYVVSTKLMVLRKFNEEVDLDYFYYCLTNQTFLEILQRRAENRIGSFPQITFDLLGDYKFPIPTLAEQKQIASVIAHVDSKIRINQEINRNLEAMARQLYDYWFVQFDFPDKNGKPYKFSGGKMVWNEKLKREIPEGWDAALMKDFLVIGNGKDHKDLETGIYPVYGSGGLMRYVNEFLFSGESVLLPRKGSLSNFMYVNESFWTVDTMFYTKEKLKGAAKYIYYSMRYVDITRYDSGTGVPSMTSISYYAMPFVKPTNDIIKLFDEILSPWIAQIRRNEVQIKNLTKQRDELLPLLMNGQVSVMPPEVNCDLEAAKECFVSSLLVVIKTLSIHVVFNKIY